MSHDVRADGIADDLRASLEQIEDILEDLQERIGNSPAAMAAKAAGAAWVFELRQRVGVAPDTGLFRSRKGARPISRGQRCPPGGPDRGPGDRPPPSREGQDCGPDRALPVVSGFSRHARHSM